MRKNNRIKISKLEFVACRFFISEKRRIKKFWALIPQKKLMRRKEKKRKFKFGLFFNSRKIFIPYVSVLYLHLECWEYICYNEISYVAQSKWREILVVVILTKSRWKCYEMPHSYWRRHFYQFSQKGRNIITLQQNSTTDCAVEAI